MAICEWRDKEYWLTKVFHWHVGSIPSVYSFNASLQFRITINEWENNRYLETSQTYTNVINFLSVARHGKRGVDFLSLVLLKYLGSSRGKYNAGIEPVYMREWKILLLVPCSHKHILVSYNHFP